MDFVDLLQRCRSDSTEVRKVAEETLHRLETENYSAYIHSLCTVFNGTTTDTGIQRLAAIVLKNTLQSKNATVKADKKSKWVDLDADTKGQIHRELLKGLHHQEPDVSSTVAMVISTVAAIDLQKNTWPNLIPTLLQNMDTAPAQISLQTATLDTMGYLCEELIEIPGYSMDPSVVDQMLTAIVRGMSTNVTDTTVRLSATKALLNALEFAEKNFNNEQERIVLMRSVGEAAMCPTSEEVREVGFECLAKICQIYYNLMVPYMSDIFNITVKAMQQDEEDVAKQAIEVWSTICEEEIILAKDLREQGAVQGVVFHNLASQACDALVPVLLDLLMKQDEDQELDDYAWTVSMAAGACLTLMAECVGNKIIPLAVNFIQHNIKKNETPEDWRCREAATFAFGAILEGPDEKELVGLASSGLLFLLGAMKDQDPHVRNTTAWTIGRIFEFVHSHQPGISILSNVSLEDVIRCLIQTLADRDELHIQEKVCYAIEKLAEWCGNDKNNVNLSPHYKILIDNLFKTAFHPIDCQTRIRVQQAAFEAMNGLVRSAKTESLDLLAQMIPYLGQKLTESLANHSEGDTHAIEVQGMICGCFTVIFSRLSQSGRRVQLDYFAPQIFQLLKDVLQVGSSDAAVMEEVMNALAALISSGVNCQSYPVQFLPYIENGLKNHSERYAFLSCVGVVTDMCTSLGLQMYNYSDGLINILCNTLSNATVRREIKPTVLSLLGDICLAISDRFSKYTTTVVKILRQATQLAVQQFPNIEEEDIEFINSLMLGIIEAYTGITQGLGEVEGKRFVVSEMDTLMSFLSQLSRDRTKSAIVTKEAMGLLGDIISKAPSFNPDYSTRHWMELFIRECLEHNLEEVREAARRTNRLYQSLVS